MTEGDDEVDNHQELRLGSHPTAGRYSYDYKGQRVHADANQVGDMFAAGLRTWDDPYVADTLHRTKH